MSQTTLTGSCLCGAVKFQVTGEPTRFFHCHCSRCRKATGTGHASNLFLQPASLEWTRGEEQLRSFKVPEGEAVHQRLLRNLRQPPAAPDPEHRRGDHSRRIAGRPSAAQARGADFLRLARVVVV